MISAINFSSLINTATNTAKRGLKMAPDFIFGTGSEAFINSLKKSVRGVKTDGKYTGGSYKNFWSKLKEAFKASEKHNNDLIKQEGGFLKAMKKNIKDIPSSIKEGWATGKASGVGKALLKKMPLIGAIAYLGFELPNIVKATYNGGIVDGAAEVVKTGARAFGSMTGFCIGQALCPIPLVGGIIGGIIGDVITSKIVGKSYSEKEYEQKQKIEEAKASKGFDTGTTNPFALNNNTADYYMMQQLQMAMMQNPELFAQYYADSKSE